MTFSKHNWNQLSESSKRELKKRQAYEQGYQDALNEQMGAGNAMGGSKSPSPSMTTSSAGMQKNVGAGRMQMQTTPRQPYPPEGLPAGKTYVDENGDVWMWFSDGDSKMAVPVGCCYQEGPPATFLPHTA